MKLFYVMGYWHVVENCVAERTDPKPVIEKKKLLCRVGDDYVVLNCYHLGRVVRVWNLLRSCPTHPTVAREDDSHRSINGND